MALYKSFTIIYYTPNIFHTLVLITTIVLLHAV